MITLRPPGAVEGAAPAGPTPTEQRPDAEAERLAVLRSFGVLDTDAEAAFDALTELAAQLCGTPMALISLVDEDRQWFKSRLGLDLCETSRADSFCTHALHRTDVFVVPDATLDDRFADNPYVVGDPRIRFYAGAPLLTPSGHMIGSLCVLDTIPRAISGAQRRQLQLLADQVVGQLTLRKQASELAAEVAARRASELALAANHRLLRGVLSHPDALIYAKDLDGRYIMGNAAIHDLMNVPDGSLIGRTDLEVLPAAAAAVFGGNDRTVAGTGRRTVVTEQFVRRDGSISSYLSTKFPLRTDDGETYAVAGISTDVTVQSAAEEALKQSERRWRQLFDESPVGIGLSDEHGLFVAVNPALCALFGRDEAAVLGHSAAEFTHPDDMASHRNATSLIESSPGGVVRIEKRYVQPNGHHRWAWLTVTHTPGPNGEKWTLAHVQDVTDRLLTEQAVRDSEANLTAVAAVVQHIQTGADARQTIVNACAELAGAASASLLELDRADRTLQVTATSMPSLLGGIVAYDPDDQRWVAFLTGAAAFLPYPDRLAPQLVTDAGIVRARAIHVVPVTSGEMVTAVLVVAWTAEITDPEDRRAGVVTMLADQAGVALRQLSLLAELEVLAHTDPLTGLPNRRSWERTLIGLMTANRRNGRPLVIALIDFDHFKAFNDSRGHAAGDALLCDFAEQARATLKTGDTLARWGGEEFALALHNCPVEDAQSVLMRVKAAMPENQTCSIGYAVADATETPEQLMIRVDTALYLAKNSGRNRIQQFELWLSGTADRS